MTELEGLQTSPRGSLDFTRLSVRGSERLSALKILGIVLAAASITIIR